jgi:hypothetical protein
MTNELWYTAFFTGVGLVLALVGIFQFGLNMGIRISMQLLDGEYPAAFKFLEKNKKAARVLPYMVAGKE